MYRSAENANKYCLYLLLVVKREKETEGKRLPIGDIRFHQFYLCTVGIKEVNLLLIVDPALRAV